jgi:hypothetical protein
MGISSLYVIIIVISNNNLLVICAIEDKVAELI